MGNSKNGKVFVKKILFIKVFSIFYITCLGLIYLTSSTEAKFTHTNVYNQVITAGTWWDGSSLLFNELGEQTIESCDPVMLSVEVTNDSKYGMYGTTEYEIYKMPVETSNSLSEKVAMGQWTVPMLGAGESGELTYLASNPGEYLFLAKQRPGYNHNEKERAIIMSEIYSVTCNDEMHSNESNESASQEELEKEEENSGLIENEIDGIEELEDPLEESENPPGNITQEGEDSEEPIKEEDEQKSSKSEVKGDENAG